MINNQLSTSKKHSSLMNESSGQGNYTSGDVAKTGDKSSVCGVFVVKRVLNRI